MQKDAKDKFDILTDQQKANTDQVMMQVKDLKTYFKGSLDTGEAKNEPDHEPQRH
jgi:hypothetical protein